VSQTISKKQIAEVAGISPRTMRRNHQQWSWLEKCRLMISKRPAFNREQVTREMRRRKMV
jgi:hypothetical protein